MATPVLQEQARTHVSAWQNVDHSPASRRRSCLRARRVRGAASPLHASELRHIRRMSSGSHRSHRSRTIHKAFSGVDLQPAPLSTMTRDFSSRRRKSAQRLTKVRGDQCRPPPMLDQRKAPLRPPATSASSDFTPSSSRSRRASVSRFMAVSCSASAQSPGLVEHARFACSSSAVNAHRLSHTARGV